MLIDTFVNAIYLYDDEMLLTFNFKEGTNTIAFDDVRNIPNKYGNGSDLDWRTAPQKASLLDLLSAKEDAFRRLLCFVPHFGEQFAQKQQLSRFCGFEIRHISLKNFS